MNGRLAGSGYYLVWHKTTACSVHRIQEDMHNSFHRDSDGSLTYAEEHHTNTHRLMRTTGSPMFTSIAGSDSATDIVTVRRVINDVIKTGQSPFIFRNENVPQEPD